jgi:glyoxylase-like metal-dependent hydrolase (beta-lactamase superfamily II)
VSEIVEALADEPKPIVYGVASALSPMVRRIVCENPSAMTGPGTNTYLVGIDEIAVIDPGPDDARHLDAIAGCGGDRIRWILLTHTHVDHAPGAQGLKDRTGADILAYGPAKGYGDTPDVPLDGTLGDGDVIEATEYHLSAVHTPGHASNHLCFLLPEERTLFTGDHIMQGSTVVVAPPDGDMRLYLESLEKLKHLRPRLRAIAPGHGHLIHNPTAVIDGYIAHRVAREQQIVTELRTHGPATVAELVGRIYTDTPEELRPVASLSVWSHLRKLVGDGLAAAAGSADIDDTWSPVGPAPG